MEAEETMSCPSTFFTNKETKTNYGGGIASIGFFRSCVTRRKVDVQQLLMTAIDLTGLLCKVYLSKENGLMNVRSRMNQTADISLIEPWLSTSM